MELSVQITSLIVSFLYGIFLSIVTNINYYFLFTGKKVFRIIGNILFAIDAALLYFLLMQKINFGIIHPYFYGLICLGYCLTFFKFSKLRKIISNLFKSVKSPKE